MKRLFILLISLSFVFSACVPQGVSATPVRAIDLQDCTLRMGSENQVDALCGSLSVAENPADPQGRQIPLNLVVIPAIKRSPAPDPLFLLAGGPGQSAVETFPVLLSVLFNIHQERDIVLVDQRGTGKSNPLSCLGPEDEALDEDGVLAKLKACPGTLDADLRFYTTEIAMRDLDAVRVALGYDQINLYGASYGTRAALTYLRMFPDHVRTLTLDSVVDPSFILFLDAARDGQTALDHFFARCQSDPSCSSAFPGLQDELTDLLDRLEKAPVEVSMRHPLTSESLELTLTRDVAINLIFNILYSPDLLATLPVSIHTAYSEGNFVPLVSLAYMLDAGLYDGMFYAVACAEDAPLIQAADADRLSAGTVFGDRTESFVEVCDSWPRGTVSPEFRSPIVSDVPVLVLSGEADPITPPRHAELALQTLPNSLHLIFAGMGHGNLSNRCSMRIVGDFIESASVAGLDATCVAGISPPPFFLNFNGPRP